MTRATSIGLVLVLALVAGVQIAAAQAHNHIGHVMDRWNDTPEMAGLLPAAIAEAEIAARHASLAASDPSNLDSIKRHTAHVLHAVDPTQIENGPGNGYGVKQAAEGAARHIMAAANSEDASGAVKTHANHVATSAQNTVTRADEIVMLAQKIDMATSADDAAGPRGRAQRAGPGAAVRGWTRTKTAARGGRKARGGLEVALTHGNLMKQAEGL